MRLGLILPSYSTISTMQIPSLSLLTSAMSNIVDITVIPLRNPPGLRHMRVNGVEVLDPGGAQLRFRSLVRRSIDLLRSQHRQKPFDILHAYWLYEPGAIAIAAGRILGIPVVCSVGGAELASMPDIGYGGQRSRRGRLVHASIMRSATLITGGSSYVLDLARNATAVKPDKLKFAPLPVDSQWAKQQAENPYSNPDGCRLLQVGAFLPVKGQDISLRAFGSLAASRSDLMLTMIGEDPYSYRGRMKALANQIGLGEQVQLLERIPHDSLASYYQHSDLLLMPSRHESQGMVVLEAAAFSLPAVGSDVGVLGDFAPVGGAIANTANPAAFATQIATLIDDRDLRTRIGNAAREITNRVYSLTPVVDRWLEVYREAIDAG